MGLGRLTPRPRMRGRALLGIAMAVMAFSLPARADLWYEHYENAERAIAEGNWNEAIQQASQALAKRSESGASVRTYGVNLVEYFPHLKLAIAYYNLGQVDAALNALATEENVGAVQQSDQYQVLQDLRDRINQDKAEQLAEAERKTRSILDDALAEARRLQGEGRFDDALKILDNGLAVDPDDRAALQLKQDLLDAVSAQEQQRANDERVSGLMAEGRSLLAAGSFSEAASKFSQALQIKQDPAVQALYDDAQQKLGAQIAAQQDAQRRAQTVSDGLSQAERLEAEGKLSEAIGELQTVLAIEPQNRRALDLRGRLLATQSAQAQERDRLSRIDGLLADAEARLQAGDYNQAAALANNALALDRGNPKAMGYIQQAYASINTNLLSPDTTPPLIAIANQEELQPDGTSAEVARNSRFTLSGQVIDSATVDLKFTDGAGQELEPEIQVAEMPGFSITMFTLRHRLPPGKLTTFDIVATDKGGLEASDSFNVVYVVPFFRTPLGIGAVGAVLASLAMGGWVVRVQRRNRLLKRRFNPYIAGAPILQNERFVGRERLLNRVLQSVHNNSILLYGERRIGKTSFQHQLKRRLTALDDPDYQFFPVFVDLQGTPQEKFFSHIAEEVFEELEPKLNGVEPGEALTNGAYEYRDFVRDLRNVLRALEKTTDKKVKLVLQIDEVDELNNYDPKVNQKLRGLFMRSFAENLVSVVSGVGIKKQWESEGSPWYNFFEEIRVKPFRQQDAVELIEKPIRGVFKLESGVAERIIDVTDCKPYLIQKMCVSLVNRLHEEKRRTITMQDVEAVGRPVEA